MQIFSFLVRHPSIYFSIVLFMVTGTSYSFISHLDHWKRDNQNIYCLSNTQISTKYNQRQLDELAVFALSVDAHIIVKDMLNYTGKNTHIKNYLDQSSSSVNRKDFLLGSKHYLHSKGVPEEKITNVEYQQAAIAAIDGSVALSTNDVMKPAYNEYHKGWKYRDEKMFDQYYKSKLQEYKQTILKPCRSLFFYMYWRKGRPLSQVLSNAHYYEALDSVVTVLNGDITQSTDKKINFIIKHHGDPLITIKIANAIAQINNQNIIICADANQINEINSLLQDANCTCIVSQIGSVRIGSKKANLPRALRLNKVLKKNNVTSRVTQEKHTITYEHNTHKKENRDINWKMFCSVILLFFVIFIFQKRP